MSETKDQKLKDLSKLRKAFSGKLAEDYIKNLTNLKHPHERSNFPTYSFIARQVYLRLLAKVYPKYAKICKEWADIEAEVIISLKGLSRAQMVEIETHRRALAEQQILNIGTQQGQPETPKRHFWQRKPKTEPSEFKENEQS